MASWLAAIIILSLFGRDGLAASDLSAYELLRLKKGEVLVAVKRDGDPSKGKVEATIMIEAPKENIWEAMVNCQEAPTFVPGLKSCQVLSSGKDWEIIRHEVKWIWFWPTLAYVFRATYQKYKQIDFVKTEGDIREMTGSWRLTPINDGQQTIVRYKVYLDPGFFAPRRMVRKSLKKNLPAVLVSLRSKVLQDKPQ